MVGAKNLAAKHHHPPGKSSFQSPRHAPPVAETPPANFPIPPTPLTPDEEAIRNRAYQLWERAGQPDGDGVAFWLEAERELHSH